MTNPTAEQEVIEHDEHIAQRVKASTGEFWPNELHPGSSQLCACGQVLVGPREHWHTYTRIKCHTAEKCT